MNKKLILLFLVIFFATSCKTLDENHEGYMRRNYYSGKKLDSIVKKLGKDYVKFIYEVNQDYWFHREREPDYWKYLSKEEIDSGVVVYEYWWGFDRERENDTDSIVQNAENMNIVVWARERDGALEVFASLEYQYVEI